MKQIVKIMSDGISNEIAVPAETHEEAVELVFRKLQEKNEAGEMLSEQVTVYSKSGMAKHTVINKLCDDPGPPVL